MPANKPKDWKEFEILVTHIERSLRGMAGVVVEHNVMVDSVYGVKRQIDVLIRYSLENETKTIAIECKKTKSKLKIDVIDAFHSKSAAIGATERIVVAATGFQQGALKAAAYYGIKTFVLSQALELQAYLQSYLIFPCKINQELIDIVIGFTAENVINEHLTMKSSLWGQGMEEPTTIAELLSTCLEGRKQQLTHEMFTSFVNPRLAQCLTASNEIVLQFPDPMVFKHDSMETEVSGFRAQIRTTLITGPATLDKASIYEDLSKVEPNTFVCELNMDQANLEFLQKVWSKRSKNETVELFK